MVVERKYVINTVGKLDWLILWAGMANAKANYKINVKFSPTAAEILNAVTTWIRPSFKITPIKKNKKWV
jgi:hypothetical protein